MSEDHTNSSTSLSKESVHLPLRTLEALYERINTCILDDIVAFKALASSLESLSPNCQTIDYLSSLPYRSISVFMMTEKTITDPLIDVLNNLESSISIQSNLQNTHFTKKKNQVLSKIDPAVKKLSNALTSYDQERSKFYKLIQEALNALEDIEAGPSRDPVVGYDLNHIDRLKEKLKTIRKKLETTQLLYIDSIEVAMNRQEEAKVLIRHGKECTGKIVQEGANYIFSIILNFSLCIQELFKEESMKIDPPNFDTVSCIKLNDIVSELLTLDKHEHKQDIKSYINKLVDTIQIKRNALRILKIFLHEKKERYDELVRILQKDHKELLDIVKQLYKQDDEIYKLVQDFVTIMKIIGEKVEAVVRSFALKLLSLDNLRAEHNAYHEDLLTIILEVQPKLLQVNEGKNQGVQKHKDELVAPIIESLEEYKVNEESKIQNIDTLLQGLTSLFSNLWVELRREFTKLSHNCSALSKTNGLTKHNFSLIENPGKDSEDLHRSIESAVHVYRQINEIPWNKAGSLNEDLQSSNLSPRLSTFRSSVNSKTPRQSMSATKIGKGVQIERTSAVLKSSQSPLALESDGVSKLLRSRGLVEQHEELLDTFSCSIQGKKANKGRMYIFTKKVCFYSGKLQGDLLLLVPREEMIAVEKRTSSVIFDDGLVIHTRKGELLFVNFMYRDKALNYIQDILKQDIAGDVRPFIKEAAKKGHRRATSELAIKPNNVYQRLQNKAEIVDDKGSEPLLNNPRELYTERQDRDHLREDDALQELYKRQEVVGGKELLVKFHKEVSQANHEKDELLEASSSSKSCHFKDEVVDGAIMYSSEINAASILHNKAEKSQKALSAVKKLNISNIQNFDEKRGTKPNSKQGEVKNQDIIKEQELRRIRIISKMAGPEKFERQVYKEVFDCNVKDLFIAWFSEHSVIFKSKMHESFWMVLREEDNNTNIRRIPWTPLEPALFGYEDNESQFIINQKLFIESTDVSERTYIFDHPAPFKIPFGPKTCEVKEHQKIYWSSINELALESELTMSKFPFTDSFLIRIFYGLKGVGDDKCEFLWKMHVEFLKSVPFQNQIVKSIEDDNVKNSGKTIALLKDRLKDVLQLKQTVMDKYQYNQRSASNEFDISNSGKHNNNISVNLGQLDVAGREVNQIHDIQEEEEPQETEMFHKEEISSEGQISLRDGLEEVKEQLEQRFIESVASEQTENLLTKFNVEETITKESTEELASNAKQESDIKSKNTPEAAKLYSDDPSRFMKNFNSFNNQSAYDQVDVSLHKKAKLKSSNQLENKIYSTDILDELKKVVNRLDGMHGQVNKELMHLKMIIVGFLAVNVCVWIYLALNNK